MNDTIPTPTSQNHALQSRDDFSRNVYCLLGIPIDAVTLAGATDIVTDAIAKRERLSFVTPNVNWLVNAAKNPKACKQIIAADLSIIDGAPLVKMAKWLKMPITERLAGSDLFEQLRTLKPSSNVKRLDPIKIYFFGGRDGAAQNAYRIINKDHKNEDTLSPQTNMKAVGWHNPGFGSVMEMSTPEIISKINESNPDFIIVALGAAKGQDWIEHNGNALNAPAISHLGAVVDFTAGNIERAPEGVAKAGFEWLWRIKAERSLWKRYAKDAFSLSIIIIRRLLPQLLRPLKKPENPTPASVTRTTLPERVILHLTGSLSTTNLDPIKDSFRNVALEQQNLCLDFQNADYMDHAFLGLCQMLLKHQYKAGKQLTMCNIAPKFLRFFKTNAIDIKLFNAR